MSTLGTVDTPRKQPFVNRSVSRLLRSPLSRPLDRSLMLLTVYGRRTRRPYTFPVQYVQDGSVLWVYVGDGDEKTWWRNLVPDGPVEVLLRRDVRMGHGVAVLHNEAPDAVEQGLRRYAVRFPRTARRLGVPAGDDAALARKAARTTMVRIDLPG